MTERLYYADAYCREFDATVTAVATRDGRLVASLDRTAFYPTSGGQPFDTGSLAGYRVVDVVDDGAHVAHVLEGAPAGVDARELVAGVSAHGSVDWARRFDHMQQHTGQHMLSAVIERLCGAATVSFHLGADSVSIDIARELSPEEIAAAERDVNRAIWDDRPVTIRFEAASAAASLPLRKESLREGTLRLVEIDGLDLSACGGTHVARTGSVGVLVLTGWERYKKGQRLTFACGARGFEWARRWREAVAGSVCLVSVRPEELPRAVEKLQEDLRDLRKSQAVLQGEWARCRAAALAAGAETLSVGRYVAQTLDADASTLKTLASALVEQPGLIVVLVSAARPVQAVIARSSDTAVDAQKAIQQLVRQFGGRGGGRPELAQAGGMDTEPADVLSAAREALGVDGRVGPVGKAG